MGERGDEGEGEGTGVGDACVGTGVGDACVGTEVEVEGAEVEGGGTEREEVVVIREQELPGRSAEQSTYRGWINVVV